MMKTEVGRGLKDKARKSIQVLDPARPERFHDPAKHLLSEILGQGGITQTPSSEDLEPVPEPGD